MDFTMQEIYPASDEHIINVIGVDGCGGNAVAHMISSGLQGGQALASPLLEGASLGSARGVLLNITTGSNMTLTEANDIYAAICGKRTKMRPFL